MDSVMPNTYVARASRRITRLTTTASRRRMTLPLLGIGIALGACGTPPPLDQAIKCAQFKRLPDGSWTTTIDVSLDYAENGTHWQENFSKGVTISGGRGGQDTAIVAAIEKKCSATK